MYVLGVSFFRTSPIVFQVKPSKPCVNVTSIRETIHDNLQRGSYNHIVAINKTMENAKLLRHEFCSVIAIHTGMDACPECLISNINMRFDARNGWNQESETNKVCI